MSARRPITPPRPPHEQLNRLRNVVALFCAGTLVVIWSFIYRELAFDNAEHAEAAMRDADNLALAFERHVDANVKAVDMALLRLREEMHHGAGQLDKTARAIASGPLREMVIHISLVDADGRMVYSTLPQADSRPFIGDREHFLVQRDTDDDRLFISQAVFGRVSQQWSIQFTRRVEGPDGRFAGVLVFSVRPEYFARFYAAVDLGPNGVVALVRDGKTILARGSRVPPAENPVGKPFRLNPPYVANGESTVWTHESPTDGIVRVGAYRHHDEYPLAVYVGLARDDALRTYDNHVRELSLVGGFLTLAVLGLGAWLFKLHQRLQQAQQLTEESENRFRRLYLQAPLAYQSLDPEARIIDVNEPWAELFGYRRDEVLGCPFADFVTAASLAALSGHFEALREAGGAEGVELEIRRRDGTHRRVAVESRADHDGNGALRQTHCILHDVTTAREQAAALEASEARLRGIVDNVGVVTWELDLPAWTFSFVSPQAERMFGYPLADWLTPGFWPAHLHPDDRERAVQFCVTSTEKCQDHDFEYRFLAHDDRVLWLRDIVKVIADETGAPVKLTGVMIDISAQKLAEANLASERSLLRSLIDSVPDLIFFKDLDSVYLGFNKACAAFFGRSEAEMIGKTDLDVLPATEAEFYRAKDREMLAAGAARRNEEWIAYPDGRRVLLDTLKAPILGADGKILGLIGVSRDITQERAAEEGRRLAETVFEATTEGIVVTDAAGTILSTNPAFSRITGWSAAEARGQTPRLLKSGRHPPEFYAEMWARLNESGHWEGEVWNRRKSGEVYPEWLSINAIADPGEAVRKYVAVFSDITQRKRQEETIWRQANFDPLTGLANRHLFHDRLEHALARGRRNKTMVGLMFIDLDRFKWINDTLGHDAGDLLLIEAARRLRACVREEDTVARLGGDEFTIILQGLAEPEPISAVADKVLQTLAAPFVLNSREQFISGSVGITVFPSDGDNAQTLLRNADIAMYRAKDAGKNRAQFYSPHMQADALARVRIENDLRQAVDDRSFTLHYQPIVDADSGELVGAEALLRWLHPTRGMISPADFVPIAEETGLIVPIGEWVIEEACRQWRAWVDAGHPPLRIAVNISSVQFRTPQLRETVDRIIRRHGVAQDFLTLEITESLLIESKDLVEERFAAMKRLGIRYSLDDFGTGYSSLSYLKRFPVDVVKIDRSFVSGCPDDLDDAHLVEAIVFMAHSLDLSVTAEGVETPQQLAFLRDLGCDYIQGYLVSRPVDATAFAALLERRLLLPDSDPAHAEETRYLAALRQGGVDAGEWLQRLIGERHPELAARLAAAEIRLGTLPLREAVNNHLAWRTRLEAMIAGDEEALTTEEAASTCACTLGRWLEGQAQTPLAALPAFAQLTDAHREFHRIAASIVDDITLGRRAEARRRTRGLVFRQASRAVVVGLVDLFGAATRAADSTPPKP